MCYQFRIFNDIPCKKYNCIFEFVKVMFKKYVGPFFAGHGPENCIVNDVTITSSLRSIVQVLLGHFYDFSVRMIRAKNYEKLSKFVKVTAKILSVPFFPDTVYVPHKQFCELDIIGHFFKWRTKIQKSAIK